MNSQGATGKPWMPTLTLENYLNLENVDVISSLALRKNDLLDAVRSIELMDAHHSTLHCDGVSSNALLSLNDVIKDLSLLHWQECCITSLETINSVTDFSSEDESSPKRSKLNCNTSSSSKEDSEGHKAHSQVLKKKIKGPAHYGQKVDQVKRHYGQQVDKVKRPKSYSGKEVAQINRPKAQFGEQMDQVKRPKAQLGEQVDHVNRPQRGTKKPVWMKEYVNNQE